MYTVKINDTVYKQGSYSEMVTVLGDLFRSFRDNPRMTMTCDEPNYVEYVYNNGDETQVLVYSIEKKTHLRG